MTVGCAREGGHRASSPPKVTFPTTLSTSPPLLTRGAAERAAPRWEQVTRFSSAGPLETPTFAVASGAIQWRVRWNCTLADFRVDLVPPPTKPGPLVTSRCPSHGEAFSIRPGQHRLRVRAAGPWEATVEQQVDTPVDEPPLAGMTPAAVLATGAFRHIDKTGRGTATIYRLPDGRRALRFSEDFQVLNDTNLVVWLSEVAMPRTSSEVVERPHVEVGPLKSTRGSQNYIVPDGVPPQKIRSVALYCVPVPSIYIAAPLGS